MNKNWKVKILDFVKWLIGYKGPKDLMLRIEDHEMVDLQYSCEKHESTPYKYALNGACVAIAKKMIEDRLCRITEGPISKGPVGYNGLSTITITIRVARPKNP